MTLYGTRAVVTGAAQGIGLAIAQRLRMLGASLVINDVQTVALESAKETLLETAVVDGREVGEVNLCSADLRAESAAEEVISTADRTLGGLDILVNNAAITVPYLVEEMPHDIWDKTIRVNLTAPFLLSKAAVKIMKREGQGGRIINISSIAAKRISVHGGAAYTASKAGLLGFTRHLAFECAPYGVTVNAVCPGGVSTPRLDELSGDRGRDKRLAQIPTGRFLSPEEVAEAVSFLASESASGITGVALDVDGGSLLGWEPIAEYEQWVGQRASGT